MWANKTAYLSPKLAVDERLHKGGFGVFAQQPVKAGELIAVWCGEVLTWEQLGKLSPKQRQHCIQIEEALYLKSPNEDEPADCINHSCEPNVGLDGQIVLRALRDIAVGEEICYDYAMSDGSAYDEFICTCGEPTCRHYITGDDWRITTLQIKYAGWFSPYLQRRIHQLNSQNVWKVPAHSY